MSPDYPGDLEKLRAIALALPEAAERESHGSPGFHIEGGKFSPISGTIITTTARPQ